MIVRLDKRATENQAWRLCLEWAVKSGLYIWECRDEITWRYYLTDSDPVRWGDAITGCPGKVQYNPSEWEET